MLPLESANQTQHGPWSDATPLIDEPFYSGCCCSSLLFPTSSFKVYHHQEGDCHFLNKCHISFCFFMIRSSEIILIKWKLLKGRVSLLKWELWSSVTFMISAWSCIEQPKMCFVCALLGWIARFHLKVMSLEATEPYNLTFKRKLYY